MRRLGREVWIGLADVRPRPGNDVFDDAPGAYTSFVALADDRDDALRVVAFHFDRLGFETKEIEDLEPIEDRLDSHGVSDEILDLVTELSRTTAVVHGVFHIYETEEE